MRTQEYKYDDSRLPSSGSEKYSAEQKSVYIPTLDGWRCIAILLVIFSHTFTWLGLGTAKLGAYLHYTGVATHIDRAGSNGVGVFFCLSGFLITKGLVDSNTGVLQFYLRRAFRILPAAFAYLGCASLLALVGFIPLGINELVASLFFYRNYLDVNAWYTGHFWSLAIEEQFYLGWPTVLAVAGARGSRIFGAWVLLSVIVWRQFHWPLIGFSHIHTEMHLDAILCGSLMALYWPRLHRLMMLAPLVLFPVALGVYFTADAWSTVLEGTTDVIQAVAICVLIAGTISFPASPISRTFESAYMRQIGRMSYSIYLWQQLLLQPVSRPHIELPLRLLGIAVIAWLSFRFIEQPAIAFGRRLVSNRRSKDSQRNSLGGSA